MIEHDPIFMVPKLVLVFRPPTSFFGLGYCAR
jgi:hypothetical protein